jgi:hypothetical protein
MRNLKTILLSALLLSVFVGCDNRDAVYNAPPPPHEGTYKNDKGQVVLEIKGSSLFFTNAQGRKVEVGYSNSDGKLMVESSSGNFTLTYQDGTITGLPANIAKSSAPLKKDAPPPAG